MRAEERCLQDADAAVPLVLGLCRSKEVDAVRHGGQAVLRPVHSESRRGAASAARAIGDALNQVSDGQACRPRAVANPTCDATLHRAPAFAGEKGATMQNTIRLALVVVMAATSARVFADEYPTAATTKVGVDAPRSEINAPRGEVRAGYDALGSGSGEPGRADTRLQEDAPADKNAAIREFNRQAFLREVWALP